MSRFRIVVADQAEAIFYDTASLERRPAEVGRISDPLAHLHARDFSSDRPGRSYESMGGQRHAIARENADFPQRRNRGLPLPRGEGRGKECADISFNWPKSLQS